MSKNNNALRRPKESREAPLDIHALSTEQLYQIAEKEYAKVSSGQQSRWSSIIKRGGTKKDRLNLMATEILNNPHTSLQQFEELVHECFDKNHHNAVEACQVLTNLFHEFVFVDKECLSTFNDSLKEVRRANKKSEMTVSGLLGCYLEHHIKHFYAELVRGIEGLLGSSVGFVKKSGITMLASLTRHKELRRLIISMMINKFGDSDMEVVNHTYKSLKMEFYQDLQSSSVLLEEA